MLLDIQSFYHDGATEFSWENGDATKTTSEAVLNLQLWISVIAYIVFGYFTLINYSHFDTAKSWADYTSGGFNLS